jgi:hypothetical protein
MDREEGDAHVLGHLHHKPRFCFGVKIDPSGFDRDDKRGVVIKNFHGGIIANTLVESG